MLRLLLAFILLSGSVFLGIQLSFDPGYVLIAINHWTIETTVWVAVFGLILFFLIAHITLQLLHKIMRTPQEIKTWHACRLAQKAQATTRKGLIEYSEGYWQKAKDHLIQGLPNSDTPLLNYLTAARAAQKMGDSKLRDHYLREAQQSMPEAKIAVELTQAQLQLANNQWEQALATLRHLQDLAPRHPYVLKLLIHLYAEVRDWPHLIALLPNLKKHKVISDDEYLQLQHNTYLQAMMELAKQNQSETLIRLFNSLPKQLINDPEIITVYVNFLLQNKEYADVEALLKKSLRKEFAPKLIELYSLIPADEDSLQFAESLLKKNPHSASLYLCLGQLCINQQLWGKAKHYLELSIELNPSATAYLSLGNLHEHLNESFLASSNYKKGLELATQN